MSRTVPNSLLVALVLSGSAVRSAAQSDPLARIMGTWVRDSATGRDDRGVPNGAVVSFSRAGAIVWLAEKPNAAAKDGPPLECRAGSAAREEPGADGARGCVLTAGAGGVVSYQVFRTADGKTVPDEHGRITVSADGRWMRDEFDRYRADGTITHHRHVYRRSK